MGGGSPRAHGLMTEKWQESAAYHVARRGMRHLDRHGLIAALAGLGMHPANAMQQLRLEALTHVAASLPVSTATRSPAHQDVRRVAAQSGWDLVPAFPDPPEQAFAIPIVLGAERGQVPLGLILAIDYELRRLREVVDDLRPHHPDVEQLAHTADVTIRVLSTASHRAGLVGVVAPGWRRENARIPAHRRMVQLASSVRFGRDDLDAIDPDWQTRLAPLLSEVPPRMVTFDGENGTLSYRPMLPTPDGGLIVAVPGMVLPALARHLNDELRQAAAVAASESYMRHLWDDVEHSLHLMRIWPENAVADRPPGLAHRIYRVDSAQLLSVTLLAPSPFFDESDLDTDAAIAAAHQDLLSHDGDHASVVLWNPHSDGPSFFGLEAPPDRLTDLLLTPPELAVVARTEPGEPTALAEFSAASTRIRDSVRVFSFNLLDEYAIYRQHESSYYFSDEGRPTAITVAPGSALDLRIDAASRDVLDLVENPAGGDPVRVIPRYESTRGIFAPVDPAGQPARVAMTEPRRIWAVGPPYTQIAQENADTWHVVLDTVGYWLWELRDDLKPMLAALPGPGSGVVAVEGLDSWLQDGAEDRPAVAYRLDRRSNAVVLRIGPEFRSLAQAPDNHADRLLVASLLDAFATLTGTSPPASVAAIVDRIAPMGMKKMLLMIDAVRNVDIGPDDVAPARLIRDAATSSVLDDLGIALQDAGRAPGPTGESAERLGFLHEAVEILYSFLRAEVASFGPELLEHLLMRNEAALRQRAQHGFHLPARMACFPEEVPDLMTETAKLARASIAGRFLVEFVGASPPGGTRIPSLGAMDRLIAIADTLTSMGYAADIEYLRLADTNARLLPSGRLGVNDSAMRQTIRDYTPSFSQQHAQEAASAFEHRWMEVDEPQGLSDRQARIDGAARHEWGFTVTAMAEVLAEAMNLSLAADQPVIEMESSDFIERVSSASGHDSGVVSRVLNELTLTKRDDFLAPPEPYKAADVYPWRFNRHLSLLRKPFIRRLAADAEHLIFGRRAIYESGHYLMELISTSRLRPASREMAVLMGQFSAERGADFNERVAVELEAIIGGQVRRNVRKIVGNRIAAEGRDIGDVDVLGAQVATSTIWAIECKALAGSRTPHEIASEMRDLLGTETKIGLLGKHERRIAWLEANMDGVVTELGLGSGNWKLRPAFVVDTDLLSTYLSPTRIPVWTVRRLLAEVQAAGG